MELLARQRAGLQHVAVIERMRNESSAAMSVDSLDFDEFVNTYYQTGQVDCPDRLAEALEYAASHREQLSPVEPPILLLFFFARAATLQPKAIPQYEAVLAKVPATGRDFVSTVIRLASKDSSGQLPIP